MSATMTGGVATPTVSGESPGAQEHACKGLSAPRSGQTHSSAGPPSPARPPRRSCWLAAQGGRAAKAEALCCLPATSAQRPPRTLVPAPDPLPRTRAGGSAKAVPCSSVQGCGEHRTPHTDTQQKQLRALSNKHTIRSNISRSHSVGATPGQQGLDVRLSDRRKWPRSQGLGPDRLLSTLNSLTPAPRGRLQTPAAGPVYTLSTFWVRCVRKAH